jgi:hypothetical protein
LFVASFPFAYRFSSIGVAAATRFLGIGETRETLRSKLRFLSNAQISEPPARLAEGSAPVLGNV